MGAENVACPDRAVVLVDLLVAARAPAGVAKSSVVRLSIPARTSWNALSENEPTGPHRPLEELVPAVALEPGHARGVGAAPSAR